MKNCAVILASGAGSRTGLDIPKQFYKINNKTILEYAVEAFEKHSGIHSIAVVSNPDFIEETKKISLKYSKVIKAVSGGMYRQESSYCGIKSIETENFDNVLIHDAARPFVSSEIITRCIDALKDYKAVNTAVMCSDTIIQVNEDNTIKSVPDRKQLRRCQTPQGFRYMLIKKVHELAAADNYKCASDDCSLILKYLKEPVYTIEGSENNIKITYPSDILYAEKLFYQFFKD